MTHKIFKATLMLSVVCLAVPALAVAGSGDVIRDCSQDGSLDGRYSQGELQGALDNLPSDLDEYTDCRSVIRSAALNKAGGDKGANPRAAASQVDPNAPASKDEQGSLDEAAKSGESVRIGGEDIKPGDPGFLAAGFNNDVPTLMIVLMVLFGLAALTGAVFAAERRWPQQVHAIAGGAAKPFKAIGKGLKGGASRFRR